MKVGIIGVTGYGGVELYRVLANHPAITSCNLYTSSDEKKLYKNVYPHLQHIRTAELQPIDHEQVKMDNDVIFLATPSGISAQLTPQIYEDGLKIIDLSGDLRLKDPSEYESWYQKTAAPVSFLEEAVYGLSEINHDKVKGAKVIANPGCYPTATLLGLAPIVKEKVVKQGSIIIDAKSGVSGAGRKPSLATSFVELQDNLKIYKVHEHQHIPEIEQNLHEWDEKIGSITFSTHLVPMTRGIMATIYVELLEDWENNRLVDLYEAFYETNPFVRFRKDGSFPNTKDVYGSNYCDISLKLDSRTNRLTIVSVIDNLMKGAAGQAVQNFNLIHGFEETTALTMLPVYP
ncbi:N-acetyl-gamma-glutamyl-phosphate reductase [Bacillus sp. FJAT-47783]|uniref:N-acetyl-gamma-glutamyl-phosphate reductase n=1 Tax=Bacillus sp. FJAT-47783 TaxID=2922712 RepID=UPI001FACBFB2|nr:N-acetyl-gamma-glutamyl-phosphate reductase [Bacillus sp. FJAT-47783]